MNQQSQLYFIAIMLPSWVDAEIVVFKNDMASRFRSKKALRTASHITLKAPFELPGTLHQQLLPWFDQMVVTVPPFTQEVNNFGAFNNKRNPVIYVQPVMNASLQQLQSEVLQQFSAAYPEQAISKNEYTFSPHITIAYGDLHPALFKEAWEEYKAKQYAARFEVNSFELLQHLNGRWNVVSNFLISCIQ